MQFCELENYQVFEIKNPTTIWMYGEFIKIPRQKNSVNPNLIANSKRLDKKAPSTLDNSWIEIYWNSNQEVTLLSR